MLELASLSAALGSVKNIYDLLKGANDAQLAMKVSAEVASIQGRLIEVQQQAIILQEENQSLKAEIDKARSYTHHHSVTWRKIADNKEDGPFCSTCIGEGREMRLVLIPHVDQSGDCWSVWCPKGHIDPRAKQQGWTPLKQEQRVAVPKALVADNYFFVRQ